MKKIDKVTTDRIVREYEAGDPIELIAKRLNDEGYVLETGAKIYSTSISIIAHAAGCGKRLYRRTKAEIKAAKRLAKNTAKTVTPTKVATAEENIFVNYELIAQNGNSVVVSANNGGVELQIPKLNGESSFIALSLSDIPKLTRLLNAAVLVQNSALFDQP